jgi:hypothetical protein
MKLGDCFQRQFIQTEASRDCIDDLKHETRLMIPQEKLFKTK